MKSIQDAIKILAQHLSLDELGVLITDLEDYRATRESRPEDEEFDNDEENLYDDDLEEEDVEENEEILDEEEEFFDEEDEEILDEEEEEGTLENDIVEDDDIFEDVEEVEEGKEEDEEYSQTELKKILEEELNVVRKSPRTAAIKTNGKIDVKVETVKPLICINCHETPQKCECVN